MIRFLILSCLAIQTMCSPFESNGAAPLFMTNQNNEKDFLLSSGFVGCLYENVCRNDEECYNDQLFGTCRLPDNKERYVYQLDRETVGQLEQRLAAIVQAGLSWSDLYTQCAVRTLLLDVRSGSLKSAEVIRAVCGPVASGYRGGEQSVVTGDDLIGPMVREVRQPIHVHKYAQKVDEDEIPDWQRTRMRQQEMPEDTDDYFEDRENDRDRDLEMPPTPEEWEPSARNDNDPELELAEPTASDRMGRFTEVDDADRGSSGRSKADKGSQRPRSSVEERRANEDSEEAERALKRLRQLAAANTAPSRRLSGDVKGLADERERIIKRYISKVASGHDPKDIQLIDRTWLWVELKNRTLKENDAMEFAEKLSAVVGVNPSITQFDLGRNGRDFYFRLPEGSAVTSDEIIGKLRNGTVSIPGFSVVNFGYGRKPHLTKERLAPPPERAWTFIVCGAVLGGIAIVVGAFCVQRARHRHDKLSDITSCPSGKSEMGVSAGTAGSSGAALLPSEAEAYKDLCRQRMLAKSSAEAAHIPQPPPSSVASQGVAPGSNRSSTSSWSEEPVQTNMDISTGHLILTYMEDHLKDKDRLDSEWRTLCAYEADSSPSEVGMLEENKVKNRYVDIVPYEHSRVKLHNPVSDYINASYIVDHDPKNPAYIATQGPLSNTVVDFWQMIWEQGVVVIINLTRAYEGGLPQCHKYWPEEGSELYRQYEVHLVSEHVWCEDFLVRSFYLKNLETTDTRTVTQFHYLTWPDQHAPTGVRAMIDFRRKVNKSFRAKMSPIAVHCDDGCGRTGTYILLDMVLNRLSKGVKEIDIAASVEHLRDQRCNMVKTKEQYEFVLTAIAEEVNAVLKAIVQ